MQYRAAYWISNNRRVSIVLTLPEQAELPDHELLAAAQAKAKREWVDLKSGQIVLGTWTDIMADE